MFEKTKTNEKEAGYDFNFKFQVEMGLFQKIDNETYRLLPHPSRQQQQQPQQMTIPTPTFMRDESGSGIKIFPPNCQPMMQPITPQNSGQFSGPMTDRRQFSNDTTFKPAPFQLTMPQQPPSPPTPTMPQVTINLLIYLQVRRDQSNLINLLVSNAT